MQSVPCAICGVSRAGLLFSKWGLKIVQCEACGLVYVNPRNEEVGTEEYFRGSYLAGIEEKGVLRLGTSERYDAILRHLNDYFRPGDLLDAGCALGHFMERAAASRWNCQGVESSPYAAEIARARSLQVHQVRELAEANFPRNHFDVCVFIDSLERARHPRQCLIEVFKLLKPGGMVYISTPNLGSYRALLTWENWDAIVPTGKLYYFSENSLKRMLCIAGFDALIDLTEPASFDQEFAAARASGSLSQSWDSADSLRRQCAPEDAGKLLNQRSEWLTICAFKPRTKRHSVEASLRYVKQAPPLEGKLVAGRIAGEEAPRVFVIREGRKHWVINGDWLTSRGMSLDQVQPIDDDLLRSIMTGPPLM